MDLSLRLRCTKNLICIYVFASGTTSKILKVNDGRTDDRPTIDNEVIPEAKTEVPRDVRNSKVRKQDKLRRDWAQH